MAGTKAGAAKAAATNKSKFGDDFYASIGRQGGKVKSPLKGFGGMDIERVRAAGRKGGAISKRRPKNEQN